MTWGGRALPWRQIKQSGYSLSDASTTTTTTTTTTTKTTMGSWQWAMSLQTREPIRAALALWWRENPEYLQLEAARCGERRNRLNRWRTSGTGCSTRNGTN